MVFLFLNHQQVLFPRTTTTATTTTTAAPHVGCRQPPQMGSAAVRMVRKDDNKVVFVMGATGTGKSRLAIDLALHLGAAEVVNSDKMQVYRGLDVLTNKVTPDERAGVPHHLLGVVPPEADFAPADFCRAAAIAVESILARGSVPIVAGGSNSYIEELVRTEYSRPRYECCFLWVDVALPVLYSFVSCRVDRMVDAGLVDEARGFFDPDGDYTKGVRKAIGVSEMDRYIRSERTVLVDEEEARRVLLESAIDEIKANTCRLACRQLQKIHRLRGLSGWDIRRVDATEAFTKRRGKDVDEAWAARVRGPCIDIVRKFLASTTTKAAACCTTTATSTTTSTVPLIETTSSSRVLSLTSNGTWATSLVKATHQTARSPTPLC